MNIMFRMFGAWRCYLCIDALSEYADLSFGDFWAIDYAGGLAKMERCTLVSQRTASGLRLLKQAAADGAVVLHQLPRERASKRILNMAQGKKSRGFVPLLRLAARGEPVPDYHCAIPRPTVSAFRKERLYRLFFLLRGRAARRLVLKVLFSPLGAFLDRVNARRKKKFCNYHDSPTDPADRRDETRPGPTFVLEPASSIMTPKARRELPALLNGVTAFLTSQEELKNLFWGETHDLWKMAEKVSVYGPEYVVIKCGTSGQLLYDVKTKRRWEISAYPARVADPTGVGDAFNGGFLAGYCHKYDPLEGVPYGNISASLKIEGSGAYYPLDVMPGLAEARLNLLRDMVREV